MRLIQMTDAVGVVAGMVLGLTGLALIGVLDALPCSSMAVLFDHAHDSPASGDWLGFECERWPTWLEGLLTEWAPAILFLGLSGALAARISEPPARWQGVAAGAVVALVAFAMRAAPFSADAGIAQLCFGAMAVLAGGAAGWAGGWVAQRRRRPTLGAPV